MANELDGWTLSNKREEVQKRISKFKYKTVFLILLSFSFIPDTEDLKYIGAAYILQETCESKETVISVTDNLLNKMDDKVKEYIELLNKK